MPATPVEGIEGDLNLSSRRAEQTRRPIGPEARRWLDDDERDFLRQAGSTPCLNVESGCDGTDLEDAFHTAAELDRALDISEDGIAGVAL